MLLKLEWTYLWCFLSDKTVVALGSALLGFLFVWCGIFVTLNFPPIWVLFHCLYHTGAQYRPLALTFQAEELEYCILGVQSFALHPGVSNIDIFLLDFRCILKRQHKNTFLYIPLNVEVLKPSYFKKYRSHCTVTRLPRCTK